MKNTMIQKNTKKIWSPEIPFVYLRIIKINKGYGTLEI
jgi:hypothetical protein